MAIRDLGKLDWTLEGWRPFAWRLGRSMETGGVMCPDIGPLPARVPGSVQANLREAGLLPDWNVGVNSRACEWVEHRHWVYETRLPARWLPPGERVVLAADGLDYGGWLLIDGEEWTAFTGTLVPHRFDLGARIADGGPHTLTLVFDAPPEEQGQIGWTSRSRYFKPRYNYSWDWCPRFVPIGFWDDIRLLTGSAAHLHLDRTVARLAEDLCTGEVVARVSCDTPLEAPLEFSVRDGRKVLAKSVAPLVAPGVSELKLDGIRVEPWWPNGEGPPRTYTLRVVARDPRGGELWRAQRRIGFKRVRWLPCEGAPAEAAPWLCEVNGRPVFLQGANWVPPRLSYADATAQDYRDLVGLYRGMGCNVLRVWGGGILEKEIFYDLCDAAGILVWQEFPLSSSGIENTPPHAPEALVALGGLARSYIGRRAHHVSLLCWCGGNELTGDGAVPVDASHPCLAALQAIVAQYDPEHRFVPTSPSGPRFAADRRDYGQGLHHDVHGPWGLQGFADLDDWRDYWAEDDALFRSEVGMPGAASLALLDRYSGGMRLWPPTGEYWMHGGAWWTQWPRLAAAFEKTGGRTALEKYVRMTQAQQAEAYAVAARACKARFPRCGGFIIWMGHDLFPCPANNAVIDFDRCPKPAYEALRAVFGTPSDRL